MSYKKFTSYLSGQSFCVSAIVDDGNDASSQQLMMKKGKKKKIPPSRAYFDELIFRLNLSIDDRNIIIAFVEPFGHFNRQQRHLGRHKVIQMSMTIFDLQLPRRYWNLEEISI